MMPYALRLHPRFNAPSTARIPWDAQDARRLSAGSSMANIITAWWFFATPLKKYEFVSWDDEIYEMPN